MDRETAIERERDRWWLEQVREFYVDMLDGIPVTIGKRLDGYWWVRHGLSTLHQGQWKIWTNHPVDRFSDREEALQAYQRWKQQQENQF